MGDTIQFPGTVRQIDPVTVEADESLPAGPAFTGNPALDKILAMVHDAIGDGSSPIIVLQVRPTATGADFLTEAWGDETALRNAAPHLDRVLNGLLRRKGLL